MPSIIIFPFVSALIMCDEIVRAGPPGEIWVLPILMIGEGGSGFDGSEGGLGGEFVGGVGMGFNVAVKVSDGPMVMTAVWEGGGSCCAGWLAGGLGPSDGGSRTGSAVGLDPISVAVVSTIPGSFDVRGGSAGEIVGPGVAGVVGARGCTADSANGGSHLSGI